jgi:tetratricopeptide (TPR) repeat protein
MNVLEMSAGKMTSTERLLRPQPVGILPIPAGLLLLPAAGAVDAQLLRRCVEGDESADLPASWAFYHSARQGNWSLALEQLDGAAGAVDDYNRFVLDPNAEALASLRAAAINELGPLLEAAAYTFGLADSVPSGEGLDGELLALVLMTRAAAAIEKEHTSEAIALLEEATGAAKVASPLFAAQLLSQLSSVLLAQPEPSPTKALSCLREALGLIGHSAMPVMRCDLWMQLGMVCQENATGRDDRMNEAIGAYQEVLRSGLTPGEHRELFALAHNNLGLLYVSMRMSEGGNQLRLGIAIQSFREGLRVCDRKASPDLWASIQLNLANALQYMPSSHPEENLVQAVDLYEELITPRKKAFDPVGYGRLLSNQANALAHLGIFSPALEKLQEARKLFEWHNEPELAASTLDLVSQIHEQVGTAVGSS